MMKKTIISAIILLAIAVTLAWHNWQDGRIIARAKNTDRHYFNEIVVREVPTSKNPVWMIMQNDRYNYRCEYYTPMGHEHPWSTQTYSYDSFTASTARIEWKDEGEATVYLDTLPVFKCTYGWWSSAEDRNTEPAARPYGSPAAGSPPGRP